jgi:hypothetical protein
MTPFEVVTDYCGKQKKSDCVRDLAYSIYRQQFESLTVNKNPSADAATIAATEATLLSPGSLLAHIRSAEEALKAQFEDDLKPIRRRDVNDSFWFAVATGIIANIIYSLVIIVMFVVAKDQIASWLSNLKQEPSTHQAEGHPPK